ncbi:Swt1 family HEPN domain-containing protein [Streptomyces sp. NPDC001635]
MVVWSPFSSWRPRISALWWSDARRLGRAVWTTGEGAGVSGTELIGRGFRVLAEGLGPFVDEQMRAAQPDGGDWVAALEAKDRSRFGHARSLSVSDPALLLRVLWAQWHVFDGVLPVVARSYAGELRDVRNRWAHNDAFADSEVRRALETMELLLRRVGAHTAAQAVLDLYASGLGQPAVQDDGGLNAPRLAAEARQEPVGRGRGRVFADRVAGCTAACCARRRKRRGRRRAVSPPGSVGHCDQGGRR